jgi:hypothetical protein
VSRCFVCDWTGDVAPDPNARCPKCTARGSLRASKAGPVEEQVELPITLGTLPGAALGLRPLVGPTVDGPAIPCLTERARALEEQLAVKPKPKPKRATRPAGRVARVADA